MVKENQFFKICICRNNLRQYYEEKGYEIKKIEDYIEVNAKDLTPSSHLKIKYICDYCGEEFDRIVYSNERSKKKNNTKDACIKCSRTKRNKETNMINYGVDNPMKVFDFQLKNQNNRENNFGSLRSCSSFVNGVPVSKAQERISLLFPDFELNYHYQQYYIDLFYNNIAIEYDGKGHDLQVRMNKISPQDFKEKEKIKNNKVLEKYRLLRIIDKRDLLKENINIEKYQIKEKIENFIESDELYKEIIID